MQRPTTHACEYMETYLTELTLKTKVTLGRWERTRNGADGPKPIHKVLSFYKETVSCITCIIKMNMKQKCLSLETISLALTNLPSLSRITSWLELIHSQFPEHALFLLPYLFSLFFLPRIPFSPPSTKPNPAQPKDSSLSIIQLMCTLNKIVK